MNESGCQPSPAPEAERADDRFFEAVRDGDLEQLEAVLADDFLVIDINSGAVVYRAAFIRALADGLIRFDRLQLVETHTRRRGDTAIIVGRTEMVGYFSGAGFANASRYTHVFVHGRAGRWRLANAQGTKVVDG